MNRYTLFAATGALLAGSAALSADKPAWQARQEAEEAAGLNKALAGLTPQKPMACIDQSRIRDTQRYGRTILYKYSSREVYRADTDGGCFGLNRGDAIVTETPSGDLCGGDILHTVDLVSHIPSGSCGFRTFIPYRR